MDPILLIVVSLVVGLIVGMLSGLLGIGGGTLMVPVFKLAFGMSAIASTATSLFVIVPTSISGAIEHLRNRTCIPLLGVSAGIGGALMSPVGVWLASMSPEWAIVACTVVVIAYSAITMFVKAEALRKRQRTAAAERDGLAQAGLQERGSQECGLQEGSSQQAALQEESSQKAATQGDASGDSGASAATIADAASFMRQVAKPKLMLLGAAIGLGAGLLSGYVGVGGGFIMVPLFMQLLGTPMKLTSGTSLIAVLILATSGTVAQAILGNVVWGAGICMALGCIPGAFIGSKLIKRVPELALRYVFSAFLIVAAAMLALNQLGIL